MKALLIILLMAGAALAQQQEPGGVNVKFINPLPIVGQTITDFTVTINGGLDCSFAFDPDREVYTCIHAAGGPNALETIAGVLIEITAHFEEGGSMDYPDFFIPQPVYDCAPERCTVVTPTLTECGTNPCELDPIVGTQSGDNAVQRFFRWWIELGISVWQMILELFGG